MTRTLLPILVCATACGQPASLESPATTDRGVGISPHARPGDGHTPAPRRAGVPHLGIIDQVVLTADGRAAMTRDSFGSVRLWPTLDGSAEPQLVPVRGARSMSIARHTDGWTIAVVDAAQAGRILRASPGGETVELAALPPFDPLLEFHVLAGGTRVLGLARDHTVRLYDDSGQELARLQRRNFRPTRLLVSKDGTLALAVSTSRDETGKTDGTIRTLTVRTGASPSITASDEEHAFSTMLDPAQPTIALAPDGKRFAYANRPTEAGATTWNVEMIDLATGEHTTIPSPIQLHLDANIGFVSDGDVLAYSPRGAMAWLMDPANPDGAMPRPAPAQHSGTPPMHAYAGDRLAVGISQWLYVQDVSDKRERYLGYDVMVPITAALSPAGQHAAWVSNTSQLYVEDIGDGDGATARIRHLTQPWMAQLGVVRASFIDEHRLVAVDRLGGIRLIDLRTNETLAEAGAGGGVRDAEVLPAAGLVRVTRHHNDTWLFEIKGDELVGPYMVIDNAPRAGLLEARTANDPVLWTLDSANKLRTYTLAELRKHGGRTAKDKDAEAEKAEPEPMPTPAIPSPIAIDRRGARYAFTASPTGGTLIKIERGGVERELAIARSNISRVVPSPDGSRLVVAFQDGALLAYRTDTLELLWSFSTAVASNQVEWSDDGQRIVVAGNNGGAVLAAEDGSVVRSRCAQGFEVRGTPPNQFFPSAGQASLCER